jgi:hypothetical protein
MIVTNIFLLSDNSKFSNLSKYFYAEMGSEKEAREISKS